MVSWLVLLSLLMPQSNTEAEISVLIREPSTLQAVFGPIDVVADVQSDDAITDVELWVDGKSAGKRTAPPYRWQVDVGQENVEHDFKVVARSKIGLTGTSAIQTPRIQVDDEVAVELQQLYVTVADSGERVLDLNEADFRVLDNGREQDLVTFARGELPLTAVLLLDSSESMKGERLSAALSGAESFTRNMAELDEASLMLFSDQLLLSTPFTNSADVLLEPLSGLQAGGNTALNDHLYLALKLLEARQGRRVIVLFSDGADVHSVLNMEEVLWKARRSQTLVYWIHLQEGRGTQSFSTAWRNATANQEELDQLSEVVEQSGGRITILDQVEQIEPAFREILRELREQYALGYYPSQSRGDGAWHSVDVRVSRPGVKVRTRGGYVDF